MKKVVLSLLIASTVFGVGCQFPERHTSAPPRHEAPPTYEQWEAQRKARAVHYQEGTLAAEAVKMIHNKVGDPFRVMEILVYTDSVKVQVQDPHKKENVDEYEVDGGKLEGPKPVRLIGIDTDEAAINRTVYDPSTVALDKLADIVKTGNEKVQLEGREDPLVSIKRDIIDGKLEISVSYSGTRKNGDYTTNAKGEHGKVDIR